MIFGNYILSLTSAQAAILEYDLLAVEFVFVVFE